MAVVGLITADGCPVGLIAIYQLVFGGLAVLSWRRNWHLRVLLANDSRAVGYLAILGMRQYAGYISTLWARPCGIAGVRSLSSHIVQRVVPVYSVS